MVKKLIGQFEENLNIVLKGALEMSLLYYYHYIRIEKRVGVEWLSRSPSTRDPLDKEEAVPLASMIVHPLAVLAGTPARCL